MSDESTQVRAALQKRIDRAATRQRKAKEQRQVGRNLGCGTTGERVMQVDPVLFMNGVRYGRNHGVDNAWDHPEFVKEACQRHPDICVDGFDGNIGASGVSPISPYMLEQARKLVGG
jgi:hypothetical protein